MTQSGWPPTLCPYLVVADVRGAVDWYGSVYGATLRGEPPPPADGFVGHTELSIGDSVLMLTDAYAELGPPGAGQPVCHNVHLLVTDIDDTVERARAAGARVDEEPTDHRWGRTGVIVDPFGHHWMLNQPPSSDR